MFIIKCFVCLVTCLIASVVLLVLTFKDLSKNEKTIKALEAENRSLRRKSREWASLYEDLDDAYDRLSKELNDTKEAQHEYEQAAAALYLDAASNSLDLNLMALDSFRKMREVYQRYS